ncbi:MAG: hypothetical protein IPH09_14830 [bacterium]|nr:hypothetical protein [bacterium]
MNAAEVVESFRRAVAVDEGVFVGHVEAKLRQGPHAVAEREHRCDGQRVAALARAGAEDRVVGVVERVEAAREPQGLVQLRVGHHHEAGPAGVGRAVVEAAEAELGAQRQALAGREGRVDVHDRALDGLARVVLAADDREAQAAAAVDGPAEPAAEGLDAVGLDVLVPAVGRVDLQVAAGGAEGGREHQAGEVRRGAVGEQLAVGVLEHVRGVGQFPADRRVELAERDGRRAAGQAPGEPGLLEGGRPNRAVVHPLQVEAQVALLVPGPGHVDLGLVHREGVVAQVEVAGPAGVHEARDLRRRGLRRGRGDPRQGQGGERRRGQLVHVRLLPARRGAAQIPCS